MTKSFSYLKRFDLWEEIHKKSGFILTVSLTFTDDHLRKIFEPHAVAVEDRIKNPHRIQKEGNVHRNPCYAFVPYISDMTENVEKLADIARDINDFVMAGSLTLRHGKQKDLFMDVIKNIFFRPSEKIKELYKENRQSGSPFSYRKEFT